MDLSLMNRSNSASSDHQLQSYEAQDLRGPSSTSRMLSSELQHNFIPVAGYHQQQLKQQQQQQQQQQQHGPISPGGHFHQQQQQMFPFTASQWSELEHQALIFKYMVARAPVPPELVIPIRRSLILSSTNSAWGGFQMGAGSHPMDAEPGRCRRTDGKKWRCSKPVVADQKYCDRHMHRGRNRSRKAAQAAAAKSIPHSTSASAFQQQQHPPIPNFEAPENRSRPESEIYQQSVKSSSLPQSEDVQRKTPDALRHFFDDWPRESKEHSHTSTTSSEFDNARRNGLVFPPLKLALDDHETDDPYTNISLASVSGNSFVRSRHPWFTDITPNSLGGPLAEALQNPGSSNNVVNKNQIRPVGFNLLDAQLSGRKQNHHLHPQQQQQQQTNIVASPTGVLQKIACFSDCSSSASSPGSIRTDNIPHSLAQVE